MFVQAGVETKAHPLANNLKSVGAANTPTCDSSDSSDSDDSVGRRESREGSEESVGGGTDDDEEGGGFSGIRMESVKDIIAKARYAESYLRGGTDADVGENLEELAQMVDDDQEPKDEEGTCRVFMIVWFFMCLRIEVVDVPLTVDESLDDLDDNELDEVIIVHNQLFKCIACVHVINPPRGAYVHTCLIHADDSVSRRG